ncbi:hypothetical protein NL676_031635 [Syzygium grande]|nr:hypothetical protein NL676_031635 [Syzygium grande]
MRPLIGFKTLLTSSFLMISMLYILYSSNLLLTNDHHGCSLSLDLSSEDNLAAVNNFSSTLRLNEDDKGGEGDEESLKTIVSLPRGHNGSTLSSNTSSSVRTRRNEPLPEIRISGDTSKFKYTNRQGQRAALRISRVVSETLRLGMKDVRWFVMGDDDTVFIVDNVVRILSKYDHRQFYYVGSSSESHVQNIYFSYAMAYGGGGFAISYPLAEELAKMQDKCIQRYPGLYGSDDRMQACMAELGVPLTKEPGFHQYDVYGDLLGLLGAHPVTPLVSIHHLDVVEPVFPRMTRVRALRHLFESVQHDSASIMQQSICYDKRRSWSISVSWGYVVQVVRGVISPRELEMPTRTFLNWYRRADYTAYAFNTRPVMKHPCQKPFIYYMNSVRSPRRDCCRILPSRKSSVLYIWVGNCRKGEISGT